MWFFSLRTARVNKAGKKINCLGTIIQWNRHFPASPKFFLRLHGSLRQRQPSYFNAMPLKIYLGQIVKKNIRVAEALDLRDDDTPGPMWFVLTIQCNFVSFIYPLLPKHPSNFTIKTRFFFLFHLMYSVAYFFGGLLDPFNCFQSIDVLLPQYPVDFIIVSRTLSALTFTRMFSK